MNHRLVQVATEVGSIRREPSCASMRFQLATLVRGSSVTAHCPAAPALPTREYQADYRRQSLTSGATCAVPLDIPFHIRGRERYWGGAATRRFPNYGPLSSGDEKGCPTFRNRLVEVDQVKDIEPDAFQCSGRGTANLAVHFQDPVSRHSAGDQMHR